jgi:NhaP-type Na+/H+ or K+/H+ antiporter
VIPRQRVRPKPTKAGDKLVLTMFALRLGIGLVAFTTIITLAFQLPEKNFAWMVLLIGLAYLAVAGSILVKALRKYRQRYGAEKK